MKITSIFKKIYIIKTAIKQHTRKEESIMPHMVPLNKQSKKKQREYYEKQRGNWHGLCPITRVVPNKKAYNRKRDKYEYRNAE